MDTELQNLLTEKRYITTDMRLMRITVKKPNIITFTISEHSTFYKHYLSINLFVKLFKLTLSTLTLPANYIHCSQTHTIYLCTLIDNNYISFAIPSGLTAMNKTLVYNIYHEYYTETELYYAINIISQCLIR